MSGNPALQQVFVGITPPAAIVDNAAYTTAEVDTVNTTLGKAAFTNFYVYLGATDIALAALQLTESDTSGSGHSNITGATFSTLPSDTADNTCWCIAVRNDANRKRYYDLSLTAGNGAAGTFAVAWAFNCYPGLGAMSATELGLGGLTTIGH